MLRPTEAADFVRQGYLTGLRLCSPSEMAAIRPALAPALDTAAPGSSATLHRHLDLRAVYDLCAHPAIVERVASILGPDLFLWHSRFFDKRAGEPPVPWHQDAPFWSLDPMECVSAWIAIEDCGPHNGCVEVIPGSHREARSHVDSEATGRFALRTRVSEEDAARAVPISLEAGQFFIFDRWLVHRSAQNLSATARTGLSARFVPTRVRIDASRFAGMTPPYGVQLVRGDDRFGLNPLAPAPL